MEVGAALPAPRRAQGPPAAPGAQRRREAGPDALDGGSRARRRAGRRQPVTGDTPRALSGGTAEIAPGPAPLSATVRVPGSKYEANRLLLIAALTDGDSMILGAPAGDDLRAVLAALPALGATVEVRSREGRPEEVRVRGLPAPERVRALPPCPAPASPADGGAATAPGEATTAAGEATTAAGEATTAAGEATTAAGEAATDDDGIPTADAGESGTLLRLLTAAAATSPAALRITGAGRLGERPLSGLVRALRSLGAEIRGPVRTGTRTKGRGNLPLLVRSGRPEGGLAGSRALLPANETSQFASALLIAAGRATGAFHLELEHDPVSASYLDLTVEVMGRCGIAVERQGPRTFRVPAGARYRPGVRTVSGDWTSATYAFAAAALAPGRVRVLGLDPASPVGEREFPAVLRRLGCRVEEAEDAGGFAVTVTGGGRLRGVEADCSRMPDAAPTLAALAPFAEGPTRLTGVGHLRHKESDRIEALREGLLRLGAGVAVSADSLTITPPETLPANEPEDPSGARPTNAPAFDPRGDHRIAMAFAPVGLRRPGVRIRDAGVVAKSFPGYWEFLRGLGLRVRLDRPRPA